jgi:hypothetical protein
MACERFLTVGAPLTLDLADVSFIDLDGRAQCRSLREQGVALTHCSAFVAAQLRG